MITIIIIITIHGVNNINSNVVNIRLSVTNNKIDDDDDGNTLRVFKLMKNIFEII